MRDLAEIRHAQRLDEGKGGIRPAYGAQPLVQPRQPPSARRTDPGRPCPIGRHLSGGGRHIPHGDRRISRPRQLRPADVGSQRGVMRGNPEEARTGARLHARPQGLQRAPHALAARIDAEDGLDLGRLGRIGRRRRAQGPGEIALEADLQRFLPELIDLQLRVGLGDPPREIQPGRRQRGRRRSARRGRRGACQHRLPGDPAGQQIAQAGVVLPGGNLLPADVGAP
ncbi:hypothetical protein CDEN61S_00324 [Castellaniella denitrificans]